MSGLEAVRRLDKDNKRMADVCKLLSSYRFEKYVKSFAERCGFKDASRHTSRGARAVGINNLASSATVVAPEVIKNHAGHKKLNTNLIYHRENKAGNLARQAAILNAACPPSKKITSTDNKGISTVQEVFANKKNTSHFSSSS